MGASQSSGSAGAAREAATQTSYYELLGVERQAADEEIKKAYRRKALELHPDRNYGNEEWATKVFAEVRAAYEVLSDPQERAWYDSHESAILRGETGGEEGEDHYEQNVRITTADDLTRLLRKFNANVDFSDSPSGFFGFLRDTFETLTREEEIAANMQNLEGVDYPNFGHKDDEYEDIKPFYAVWQSFATKKTYAWRDVYRLQDAPDRRVRRLMEKENSQLREAGIREFNDAVRTLVAFVRKRDPRWTPSNQSVAEREKAMKDMRAAQSAKARAAHQANMDQAVPDWARARDPEEEEESEEEIEEEHFECVACHKTFKSEKQYDAHEKSKKHQKAVQALRRKMQKENQNLALDDELESSGMITPASVDEEPDGVAVEPETHDFEGRDEATKGVPKTQSEVLQQDAGSSDEAVDKDVTYKPLRTDDDSVSPSDSDYAPRSKLEARMASLDLDEQEEDEDEPQPAKSAPKMGKAAQKRAKRAAQQASVEQSDTTNKCATCSAAFPSKTRLFQHIKDFNHAAPVQKAGKSTGKGKKK